MQEESPADNRQEEAAVSNAGIGETTDSESNEEPQIAEADTSGESVAESAKEESPDIPDPPSVEQSLATVSVTMPKEYLSNDDDSALTQEQVDGIVARNGYISGTANEDGSVTFVMTKSQHKEVLEQLRSGFEEEIQALVASDTYPNFTAIETNEDLTSFIITTTSTELSLAEQFSVLLFYMYGGYYQSFKGAEIHDVHVTFMNAETGAVLNEADSSNLRS